ncbi:MAG: lipopolysaccharide biosynthesis protein [Verrucomicrobiales bacterium]|nr:lipopolysaccharide biosynthesis protein [Verrucomicrobiales bacterium]
MNRGNTIKFAVYTAIASKASSSILQLIALPLAARVLGREEFGIYSTVSLTIYMLTMLQFGMGPSLTRSIAEASAKNKRSRERHYYQHSGLIIVSLAALFSLILGSIFLTVPIETLFGSEYEKWADELRTALLIGLGLLGIEIMMWHTDSTRQGYLEAHLANGFACIGNILGAVIIIFGLHFFPSIPFLLLATFLPNILARLINTHFLWRKRPYLVAKRARFSWATFKKLWVDGMSFSATTDLVFLVEITVCGLLVARTLGPGEVAVYQVFVTITAIFRRIIETVGGPFWTASINAKESSDGGWVKTAALRLFGFYGVIIILMGIGMIGLGPLLVPLVYGSEFAIDRSLFAAQMCFLTLLGWRDVNRYILIGSGMLSDTVAPIVQGLVASVVLGISGLCLAGMEWMYLGLATGILIFPAWKLALMVLANLKQLSGESDAPLLPKLFHRQPKSESPTG